MTALPLPEYEGWDATEMAMQLRTGQVTPLEVLEAAQARAHAQSKINAIAMFHDHMAHEKALRLSHYPQLQRAMETEKAPLWGVPFALKDLGVMLKGTITTNGSVFFKDALSDQDSSLVQRYLSAGLNVFAKTTSPEFGQTATTESKLFGDTLNPWNTSFSAGGSSGGAAAAIAAGILPMAHASDGGGSIRIPASHCGLFGFKPSRGRIPMGPNSLEGWMGLSCQHVISRSVRDSALLLQLTQGSEAGTRSSPGNTFQNKTSTCRPLKIALMTNNPFGAPVHPDCIEAVQKTAKLCESLGHRVEIAQPALAVRDMFASMGIATATGMLTQVQTREAALGRAAGQDEFETLNWRSMALAKQFTALQVFKARSVFDQAGRTLDLFLTDYDCILSPVTAAPSPLIGAMSLNQPYEDFVKVAMSASPFTALFNMSGHPAMSIPLHWNAQNMPIGSHFAGRYGDEDTLFSLAAQLEQAAPWKERRPQLS
jgi:Asp-tRNA(Asn)/Glu-tRNA(Gln) amidotransferase A subunit family amidase